MVVNEAVTQPFGRMAADPPQRGHKAVGKRLFLSELKQLVVSRRLVARSNQKGTLR